MAVDPNSIDLPELIGEHPEQAEPDPLRELLRLFVQTLMSAEANVGVWRRARHSQPGSDPLA